MKCMKVVFAVTALAQAGLVLGADLVVPCGESVDLTANCTYDKITVHGTLNVAAGVGVSVKTILLGPDAGDTAVINVAGTTGYLGNGSTVVTNGLNGGTGKIVAPGSASGDDTGVWDWDSVLRISKIVLAEDVAASSAGFVDMLEIGNVTIAAVRFENKSSLRGRIKVKAGRLGLKQSYGGTFFVGAFQVDTVDGKSVSFGNNWSPFSLTGNPGDLVFAGTGSVCLVDSQNESDDQFVTLNSGIAWHGGNLVIRNYGKVKTAANDVLPYGSGKGAIKISTKNGWLNLDATTQHLNGLNATAGKTAAEGYAVRGSAGAKLVFGSGDTDGSLGGAVKPTVAVEKIGSGTLFVTNATTVGNVTVSAGTMTVKNAMSLTALTVASGATLVIDGVTLTPSSTAITGTVMRVNGGQLVNPVSADADARTAGLSLPGALVKSGSGTLVLENPSVMADHIHVMEGGLAFSGAGYDVPLYRFTVTAEANDGDPNEWSLSEFAFVDSTGTRVRKGLTERPIGTAPADLKPGEMAVPADYKYALDYWHMDALFDRGPYSTMRVSSPKLADAGKIEFYVRLPETANPIAGYNWAPSATDNSHPLSWTLSGSADGGVTWETLSQKSNFCNWYLPVGAWVDMTKLVNEVADTAVSARFTIASQNSAFAARGVQNMPATMSVEVDVGARLDFSNVTNGQVVAELNVNADNGGGTVVSAVFPATGRLVLVSSGDELPETIPLTLTSCSGVDNLASWDVVLNGVAKRSGHYRYADGALRRVRKGLCVIFR